MADALCYVQHSCLKFEGSGKLKTEFERGNEPCKKSLDYSCECYVYLRGWYDDTISCPINKGKNIKEKLK